MVLTRDELLFIIDHYRDLIAYIDRRIDAIRDSNATALLDPDIIEMQIDRLIDDRKANEQRLEKFKAIANL